MKERACPRRCVLAAVLLSAPVALFALTADDAARMMRESERRQRELQAEIRAEKRGRAQEKARPVQERHAHEAEEERPVVRAAPAVPSSLTREEALKAIDTPEMRDRLAKAEAAFNANLSQLNAVMASNPAPGAATAPLKPLDEGGLQRAIRAAAAGNGELDIPQFKALEQWREAMLQSMTNGKSRVTK